MFQGIKSVPDLQPGEGQLQIIADKLPNLGVSVSSSESALVYKREDTFYTQNTSLILNKDGTRASITYSFAPSFLAWGLGVCFFPLGFLIFIIPMNAKSDFENSAALL